MFSESANSFLAMPPTSCRIMSSNRALPRQCFPLFSTRSFVPSADRLAATKCIPDALEQIRTTVDSPSIACNGLTKNQVSHDARFNRREAMSCFISVAACDMVLMPANAAQCGANSSEACCDSGDGRKLQTVAVVGADGRTGSEVVRELCHRGINDVIAGVRRYSRASSISDLQSPEVKVIEIDLVQGDTMSIAEALQGCDAIICCVGFRPSYVLEEDRRMAEAVDNKGICKLIDAAVEASVDRFILVSSLLTNAPKTDPSYRALNMLGGVLDAKHESELHLMASPLLYTIVRPGVFASGRQGSIRLMPADTILSELSDGSKDKIGSSINARASQCVSPLAGGSSMGGRLCAVTRQQVAQVCVEALLADTTKSCRRIVEMFADSSEYGEIVSADIWDPIT